MVESKIAKPVTVRMYMAIEKNCDGLNQNKIVSGQNPNRSRLDENLVDVPDLPGQETPRTSKTQILVYVILQALTVRDHPIGRKLQSRFGC